MNKNYLWTSLKARLQLIHTNHDVNLNWLFLAGGPGLGSESLAPLTQTLKLPGSMWNLDLPGDGSNLTEDDTHYFSKWSEALIEVTNALDNVILVAHSTGGMYVLSTPELEKQLTGLVLMDSAPDASWQEHFMHLVKEYPIPGAEELYSLYAANPNNKALKQLTLSSVPYLFTQEGLKKNISFLESLPYNFRSCEWSAKHFDSVYKAKWIPQKIPTLIFAGEKDRITPIILFTESEFFNRSNITFRAIKDAGHFPWIENLKSVVDLFNEFARELTQE
jgi:pimeloyl-ACP methyl ester carboxylesterase